MQYLDFEIDVTAGEGGSYTVKVRSPAGEATSAMRFPFDQLTLTNRLQALQIALLRSSATRRRIASPESRTVQEFGQELWSALFSGDVLSRYEASRQEAKHQQAGIRIKFRCDDPELAALPWEYLYDPVRGDFVSLSTSTPLVRYIPLPESQEPIRVAPPIRILAVGVSPSDLDGLDVERERSRLTAALETIQAKGLVELRWIPGQTWQDLQDALLDGPWHIFHFIGHGGFDELRQEGIVAFARPDGRADYKRATSLGRVLGDHESLRLAVLNACESGRSDVTDLFSSTAGTLVRKGTPAVVAMQYEITDDAAIEVSRSFYGAVARGIPVDTALAQARKDLSTDFEDTLEWGTPVLFLEAPDGVLFDISAAPVVAPPPVPLVPEPGPPEPMTPEPPSVVPPVPQPPEGGPAKPPPDAGPTEPGPPEPAVPPPPRRPRIAVLAAGGGAALLAIVFVANILGAGGPGQTASPPASSVADAISALASRSPSPSTGGPPTNSPATESPATNGPPTASASTTSVVPPTSGTGILMQCYPTGTDANSSASEIYLLDPSTNKWEQITHNEVAERWPRWSPDGTFFAFTRSGNSGDIWIRDLAGTETRLTSDGADDRVPDAAPNKFIYFNSTRDHAGDRSSNIWRVPPRRDSQPRFALGVADRSDISPAWSPDGARLAFTSDFQDNGRAIYTVRAGDTGGTPEPLTAGGTIDRNPRWRPDGHALVFTRNAIGSDDKRDIWLLDLDTDNETVISDDLADEGGPVYSPDGTQIAFFRDVGSVWHIWTRDLATGAEQDLTNTARLPGNCLDPSWR